MKTDLSALTKGAVDIEIKGRFTERFLNLAFQAGIDLSNIEHNGDNIKARVKLADISALRDIARRSRCSFRIRRRLGLPFILASLKKRPILPLMIVVAIALFFFISSFIFTLTVSSPYPITAEDQQTVLDLAAKMGIEPGKSRWGKDISAVEKYILLGFNELVFAQIEERGVHLNIEIVKRVDVPPEDALKEPGHVIAACDGIIEDVLVRRGTAAVQEGDAVCAGDILIYGWQGQEAMAADGIVTARVWAEGYGECALLEQGLQPSGQSVLGIGLKINGGALLYLAGKMESPYAKYQLAEWVESSWFWRNADLAVEIIIREIGELVPFSTSYTADEARALARERAENNATIALMAIFEQASGELLPVVDSRIEDIDLGDSLCRAHAVIEGRAEIGIYLPDPEITLPLPIEQAD